MRAFGRAAVHRLACSVSTLQVGNGEVLGLVFDLPEAEWMADVRRIRSVHDSDRALFPIEITVAGSSGLGWLSPGQTSEAIAAHVRTVAKSLTPFVCTFSRVETFPRRESTILRLRTKSPSTHFNEHLRRRHCILRPPGFPTSHTALLQHFQKRRLWPPTQNWLPFQSQQAGLPFLRSACMRLTLPPMGVVMSAAYRWVPNPALNVDVPHAWAAPAGGPPVSLFR